MDYALQEVGNPVKRGAQKLSDDVKNKILADHY
jgi:hypothetical protein